MKPQVFRSPVARVISWIWIVIAVALLTDTIVRGRDVAALVAASILLVTMGIAYVTGIRPRVAGDADGIRIHNLLRDVTIPWKAVDKIEAADTLRVHSGGNQYRSWVLQTSPRARVKAEMRSQRNEDKLPDDVRAHLKGRTPAHFAAEQLTDLAATHRDSGADGPATITWSRPAGLALAVPAALVVFSIVLASI